MRDFISAIAIVALALGDSASAAKSVPVVNLFEHGPVEVGPFKYDTEYCVLQPKTFPTKPQVV